MSGSRPAAPSIHFATTGPAACCSATATGRATTQNLCSRPISFPSAPGRSPSGSPNHRTSPGKTFCRSRIRRKTGRSGSRRRASNLRSRAPGPSFANYAMALQAALDGVGVAVGLRPYVEDDIAAGPAGRAVFVVGPQGPGLVSGLSAVPQGRAGSCGVQGLAARFIRSSGRALDARRKCSMAGAALDNLRPDPAALLIRRG